MEGINMAEVPLELPTGRVVGKFIFEVQDNNDPGEEPQLVPVSGDITIKSAIDNLTIFDQTLGKFITFRGPHKAVINSEGELATPDPITGDPMYTGMSLWSNDSDNLSVKGWTYTATFNLKTADGKTLNLPPATFTLATGQEVDLADVIKVPATPGYGLPQAEGAALRAEAAAQVALDVKAMADAGEFDGAQGLPGNATMRVDTTVGTRVFITDGVTERMVSGDTGTRLVAHTAEWESVGGSAYGPFVRRTNESVEVSWYATPSVTVPTFLELPLGFRPAKTRLVPVQKVGSAEPQRYFQLSPNGLITTFLVTVGASYFATWRFATNDPWPTTLPGTPA